MLALLPVLFVISVVAFSIVHIMPGDPARVLLGEDAPETAVAALREQMGLDRPVIQRYLDWLLGVLRGDLGESVFISKPMIEIILDALGPTLNLAVLAQLLALMIAVPAGILAARRRGTVADSSVMLGAMLGVSIPSFLLGLFLVLIFGVGLGWLPTSGYAPISAGVGAYLAHLILPAIALGAMQAALIARMTRTAMLDTLSQNYIKAGKARGLSGSRLTFKHALRNASLPVLTVVGQSFGVLVSGAAVVETVFNIPGLGMMLVNSIGRRDFVVIQSLVLFVALIYVVINLGIDILYSVLDPRIRYQ